MVIHELIHYSMARLMLIPLPPDSIHFDFKNHKGSVDFEALSEDQKDRITFIQDTFISFGPLLVGVWLSFYIWDFLPHISNMYFFIFMILFSLGLVGSLTPSTQDYRMIYNSFKQRPLTSFRQIGILILSIILYCTFDSFFYVIHHIFPYLYELIAITLLWMLFEFGILFISSLIHYLRIFLFPAHHLDHSVATITFYDPMELVD